MQPTTLMVWLFNYVLFLFYIYRLHPQLVSYIEIEGDKLANMLIIIVLVILLLVNIIGYFIDTFILEF